MILGLNELLTMRITSKRIPDWVNVYISDKRIGKEIGDVSITPNETPELVDFRALHFLSIIVHFDIGIEPSLMRRFMNSIAEIKPRIAITNCLEEETGEIVTLTYLHDNPTWVCRAQKVGLEGKCTHQ